MKTLDHQKITDRMCYERPRAQFITTSVEIGFSSSLLLPEVNPTDPQQLPTVDEWKGWED